MFDKFGRELTVGDYIVYARTQGRSADLGIAKIVKITPKYNKATTGRWWWVPSDHDLNESTAKQWVLDNHPECIDSFEDSKWYDSRPRGYRYRYYDPEHVVRPEHYTYKVRAASIQGFEFAHADDLNNRRFRREDEGTVMVNLNYPNRMLKLDDVPDALMEIFNRGPE